MLDTSTMDFSDVLFAMGGALGGAALGLGVDYAKSELGVKTPASAPTLPAAAPVPAPVPSPSPPKPADTKPAAVPSPDKQGLPAWAVPAAIAGALGLGALVAYLVVR